MHRKDLHRLLGEKDYIIHEKHKDQKDFGFKFRNSDNAYRSIKGHNDNN